MEKWNQTHSVLGKKVGVGCRGCMTDSTHDRLVWEGLCTRACGTEWHDSSAVLQCCWSTERHRRTGCITAQSVTTESSAGQKSTSWRRVSTRHQHARHARRQRNLCTLSAALINPLLCGPSHARPHCAWRSVCPFILPSVRLSHTGL